MVKKLVKHIFSIKEIRFLVVGTVNTIFGYGCYALFVYLNMHYMIANVLAFMIGVLNSYILNKRFTFKTKNKSASELGRFILVYLVSFVFGSTMLFVLVTILHTNKYAAGAANVGIVTIIGWFGHNYFSFKRELDKD